jgi:hypothetical protein
MILPYDANLDRMEFSERTAPDFSAVIDLNSLVSAAHKTKTLIERFELIPLTIAALVPFALVAALELPIKEILTQLAKLVM